MDTPTAEPKKRGCFFYGCLTLSLLSMVALVFAGGGLYYAYKNASARLDEIADTQPADLRVELLPQTELEQLNARVAQFIEATSQNTPTEPLVLDAREVNSLIQSDERFGALKDRFKIELTEDKIRASISFPLELFQRPDQYFNGVATFRFVEGEKGNQLFIEDLESKGKKVPEAVLAVLKNTDLLEEARKNPEGRGFFEQVDRIQVKNGRIIIFGKAATTS